MLHSITFGDKNTYDDWGLIPIKHPVFAMPKVKTNYKDLPARDGALDLTTAIRGYPLYENREGSFSFLAPTDHRHFQATASEIAEYLHGFTRQAILEDDPEYYYTGRFFVDERSCDEKHGKLVISYSVEPYKWATLLSTDSDWLWDPFSFIDGVIRSGVFGDIPITTTAKTLSFDVVEAGRAPVKPVFVATSNPVVLTYGSRSITLPAGTETTVDGLILYGGDWLYDGQSVTVTAATSSGTATLAIKFRAGRL